MTALSVTDLDPLARRIEAIIDAGASVIDSQTYKGSYTGLFKHVIDLLTQPTYAAKNCA